MIAYAFINYDFTQTRYRYVTDICDVYNWRICEKDLNHSYSNNTLAIL